MYLVHLLLLVDAELAGAAVDQQEETTDNGENLEEIVLGEVLVGVVLVELFNGVSDWHFLLTRRKTHSPEVVHNHVEHAENDDQQGGAELGLESNNNHHAGGQAQQADNDAENGPLARENEADEEEDEQNTTGELEVHLAVLLLELGKSGKGLGLAHPRVGENHQETTHDRQVTQEEIEVKDETVPESLRDNYTHKTADGVLGMPADDDEG